MANVQIDSMTDTWNAGGTTFNAIKMNVTDTASAAASKLIDLQVGGNTKANVTKAGLLTLASGVTLTGANTLQTTTGALTLVSGSSNIVLTPSSNVGIGTTGPDKKLDVLDASAAQLRLTHTDGSVYTDFQTLSTGHQLMTTTGGNRITSTTVNDTSVLARQVQGGLAFDGVTSAVDTHAIADILTSDFSFSGTILVPTSVSGNAVILALTSSATAAASNYGLLFYLQSNGSLTAQLNGASFSLDIALLNITGVIAAYGGKVINYTFTRSGTTTAAYINGVAQTLTTTGSTGSAPAWSGSISSSYATIGRYSGGSLFNSTIFSATLFNRALSASEVITLANQGVQESDKWGSLTAKIGGTTQNGNFESGAGTAFTSWAAGASVTVAEETVDMHSGTRCPKITGSGDPSNSNANWFVCNTTSGGPLTVGKRYKYSVWLKRVSGTDLAYLNNGYTRLTTVTNTGSWLETTGDFTAQTSTVQPTTFVFGSAASSVWLIDDVTVTQVGSILDADLSAGVGYQVPDRSSNKYHGVVSATGTSWTMAQRRGQLRVSTTDSGNNQLLGAQVCLPTNAIITSIVGYTTGTPTVYVGNVSGGSQLVASVAMSASTYTSFSLAAITTTTGNVWANVSSAVTVNWTITYMIADP